jgi:hypothetical protein
VITAAVARIKETTLTVIKLSKGSMFAQIIVLSAPVSIPAVTPYLVVFFHFRESKIAGPKEAPSPLQAYETIVYINVFDLIARRKAAIPTSKVIILEAISCVLSEIFRRNILWYTSSDKAEETRRSCESAVDIIAAIAPEIKMPASHKGRSEVAR